MKCKHRNRLNDAHFCKEACRYCTFEQEAECERRHPEYFMDDRKQLAKLICEATQKTSYKCNDACKALCDCEGCCAYCMTIAEHLLQNKVTVKR